MPALLSFPRMSTVRPIGSPEWHEHIRNRLTNPDALREIVLGQE